MIKDELLDALEHCDVLTLMVQSDRSIKGGTSACDCRAIFIAGTPVGDTIIKSIKEAVESLE